MSYRRVIYAPNIHQGGGRSLLLPLLEALTDAADVMFVLDERMPLPEGVCFAGKVCRVKATLLSRLLFEWRLRRLIQSDMLLLCMGNLPPLFVSDGIQQVFVQNRYLIDNVSLETFPVMVRFRLLLERWWLRSRSFSVNRFIVQTPTMQGLLNRALHVDAEILSFAAVGNAGEYSRKESEKQYDFLYVASGEPHKNHKVLIMAWRELAEKNIFPSLCLTLDAARFPDLCAWISSEITAYGLDVSLLGECSYGEIQQLYRQSSALIYPSLFESFGLPLIEAVIAKLPVLASNASYVTDVIKPSGVFDPASPHAIARSIQVFCKKPAALSVELLDANTFLSRVFVRAEID